jgi:cysteine desulfurase
MIYLDNAASTKLLKSAYDDMFPFIMDQYANPSAVYQFGVEARNAIDKARRKVAKSLGVTPDTVYFTSGGSEADNWAILSTLASHPGEKCHIISSKIEHHAILHTLEFAEKMGHEVTLLDVNSAGMVNPEDVKAAIKPNTVLITVMFANNEIGTVEPIVEIGKIAKEHGILFHSDCVQAYGHVPIDLDECNLDMISISSHKVYGPKGVGALYIRKGVKIGALIHGGSQERARRGGTENVSGIVGFGRAAEFVSNTLMERYEKEKALRDTMWKMLLEAIPEVKMNGSVDFRVPGNLNVTFPGVKADSMLIRLDMAGICASAGSACTSGAVEPSHVLKAIGLSDEDAKSTLRFSLGIYNTLEEIMTTVETVREIYIDLKK